MKPTHNGRVLNTGYLILYENVICNVFVAEKKQHAFFNADSLKYVTMSLYQKDLFNQNVIKSDNRDN